MTRMFWVFVSCMFLFACGGGGNAPNNKVTAAEAGSDQSVIAGSTVQLDGSKSTGADGSLITYQWSIISKPAGSVATITVKRQGYFPVPAPSLFSSLAINGFPVSS